MVGSSVAVTFNQAMSNAPASIHFSYQRYVTNQIREAFDFEGVPVRVKYKARRQRARGEEKTLAQHGVSVGTCLPVGVARCLLRAQSAGS